jgi:hypothetical protein
VSFFAVFSDVHRSIPLLVAFTLDIYSIVFFAPYVNTILGNFPTFFYFAISLYYIRIYGVPPSPARHNSLLYIDL